LRQRAQRGGALAVLLSFAAGVFYVRAQTAEEYEVKAAFLFNFGRFVEWPSLNGAASSAPFRICVLGEDPFREHLDRSVKGRQIKGRDVAVERIARADGAGPCQVVFISVSERRALHAILDGMKGFSTLTVSDIESFAEAGGMIHLTLEHGQVRFEINTAAAERAGLKVSSRLLNLARTVRSG
jgi:hypothetical protein